MIVHKDKKMSTDFKILKTMVNESATGMSNRVDLMGMREIGNRVWTACNLDTDRFRNGDIIYDAMTNDEWSIAGINKQPACCYYKNSYTNGKKHGVLYNWYAVTDPRGLAPEGFHIPSHKEFSSLMYDVHDNVISLRANEAGEYEDANASGFTALLSGRRFEDGIFDSLGEHTFFWSGTEFEDDIYAYMFSIYENKMNIYPKHKSNGFSIRLVKD